MDFGYSWNDLWYRNSIAASVRLYYREKTAWEAGIIAASGLFFVGCLVVCVSLCVVFPEGASRAVDITAALLSFLLLLFSITDWCEHGNILTSTIVMAYTMWFVWTALALQPNSAGPGLPAWLGLLICIVSLASFAQGGEGC